MSTKQLYASKKIRVKFQQPLQFGQRSQRAAYMVTTPHPKNQKSLLAKLSSVKYKSPPPNSNVNSFGQYGTKSKQIKMKAKKIHENDPYNKGELLTYYCHVCGVDHVFHKGDVIVGDGNHYYSSEESDMGSGESPYTRQDSTKPNLFNAQFSDSGSDYTSPGITFAISETLCCAESFCANPKGLTATVLCYDCKDDFHTNLCGEVLDLIDHKSQTIVERHVCYKCYNLCCSGRDMCKHPGDYDGLIMCKICRKYFHSSGCGGETVVMRLSRKTDIYSPQHLCHKCVNDIYGYDTPERKKLQLEEAQKPGRKNK